MVSQFTRFNQPLICKSCGKKHLPRGTGYTELCKACFDDAGDENTHNDTHDEPVPGCRYCATSDTTAGP